MHENIIINSSAWQESDVETLFGDEPVHFTDCTDIPSLLAELQIFPSKSQARKAGREGEIPMGWTNEFKASKKRRLWIWRPSS